jgi:hypothetical protein
VDEIDPAKMLLAVYAALVKLDSSSRKPRQKILAELVTRLERCGGTLLIRRPVLLLR